MSLKKLRYTIRKVILENNQELKVVKAMKIGLDHLNKYRIYLSDGSVDYAEGKNAVVTNSNQADYKCSNLIGIIKSESNLTYDFVGVNCDGYMWIDAKSFKLVN